jgi:hypothetical protein
MLLASLYPYRYNGQRNQLSLQSVARSGIALLALQNLPLRQEHCMDIAVKCLTTCSAKRDGELIELGFVDAAGCPRSLEMTFSDAQSIAMTLPRLLADALQRQTGSDQTRYVFPLGAWSVEPARNAESVITTLATEDGFQVSFAVPRTACRGLAWALRREAESPTPSDNLDALGDIATSERAN